MQDIADRVGLSRPLVSIVLRGAPGASDESRQRVLTAARELGYHPDESARLLRRRRSRLIGVLFTMRQPFEADLVDALYIEAANRGYRLVISHMGPSRSQKTALDELMRQRIEALVILAAEGGAGTITDLPPSVPVVLLGGPEAEHDAYDEVRVENAAGIVLAVEHLADLGHHDIAYIGPHSGPNAHERHDGYRSAMARMGLTDHAMTIRSAFTEEGGHTAALELLSDDVHPTALICANDRCALGVVETLIRAGIKVPGDISVVGFDDSSVARLPFLDLTSVRPDPLRMAALAIEAVEQRVEEPDGPVGRHRVPGSLVIRSSTGPSPR